MPAKWDLDDQIIFIILKIYIEAPKHQQKLSWYSSAVETSYARNQGAPAAAEAEVTPTTPADQEPDEADDPTFRALEQEANAATDNADEGLRDGGVITGAGPFATPAALQDCDVPSYIRERLIREWVQADKPTTYLHNGQTQ
ncbi:hypothetical protein M406DRAFT_71379 [Cryphonectria parasitica EP155]|uniref:Uncharacterized protein n=1 Tax=Cryphonectria parasitica (strain ATCC 38755 / EP155) TaxID=660469 RepID=A0A9P4Y7G9_CRYP1|nr:uncharacterized protein M406DRAFT_71379 [Cryphonectria parasitica EP155]KAF3768322.1 hypothetical protein M406DRAFT_71379 [Cryphonectria parasitica EP155]